MLTARKEPGITTAALESGAVEYLTKPFSPDRLVQLIATHLGA
jgi:DNA-binding response OmpR family regulator